MFCVPALLLSMLLSAVFLSICIAFLFLGASFFLFLLDEFTWCRAWRQGAVGCTQAHFFLVVFLFPCCCLLCTAHCSFFCRYTMRNLCDESRVLVVDSPPLLILYEESHAWYIVWSQLLMCILLLFCLVIVITYVTALYTSLHCRQHHPCTFPKPHSVPFALTPPCQHHTVTVLQKRALLALAYVQRIPSTPRCLQQTPRTPWPLCVGVCVEVVLQETC